ncbi:PREDICTED: DNA primase large subunit-like [Ceratosolen solmsi marchali]|uniref:DNA primase large subunit-like n=1 Tax=Ceratosolen solmsi marchali TaxID=326594 RepID=A0AAJ6YNP1_9HYME|nr:PREDICTED: DNA primase large subunit-like [Ceratosolen solmsi marchali]
MFYIQPPKGLITLHVFEEIVFSRLEYLSVLNDNKNDAFKGKFEYLLQGSPYDYVGHFTLRLLALKSNELLSYWISKEKLLLKYRLSLIQPRQLYRLFKTIIKHINRRDNDIVNPVINTLMNVSSFYLQSEVFKHISSKNHPRHCNKYQQNIDFELIPDLVETKVVNLYRGIATVYCSEWREMLQSLFQTFILFEMKSQNILIKHFLTDPRLNILHQKLQYYIFNKGYHCETITASNIDNVSVHFPPCMMHLHLQLRHKHRLSHYARFYYTLFLKECGMSLEEAFIYWKYEYSKPHNCDSLCTHDWQTNNKKFIYSIRHMYGLEGGKKDYKCLDCNSMAEESLGSTYEGGCPFKNFDTDYLKSLLCKTITNDNFDKFIMNTSMQNPQTKCASFFKLRKATFVDNEITINKPVQYYMKMIC